MRVPTNPLARFFWAIVQVPRAFVWVVRFPELRSLVVLPLVVTIALGAALLVGAWFAASPLLSLVMRHQPGALHEIAWGGALVVTHLLLAVSAVVIALQLQNGVSSAYHERASLFVQRRVTGNAPAPASGALGVLLRAVKILPSVRTVLLWALTALCAATLILIPVAGPVLVIGSQVVLAAGFLAHGAVTACRDRLGLQRWLYFREPALLMGLTVGVLPFVLFPPLALVGAVGLSVCGTHVALAALPLPPGEGRGEGKSG